MKARLLTALAAVLLLHLTISVSALVVQVEYTDGPQDPLVVPVNIHELGTGFPADEMIQSFPEGVAEEPACWDGNDNPGIPNQMVAITNMTATAWSQVWYVADPDTTITNFDGFIGNPGLGDQCLAFKIDNLGINRPLISESLTPDNIFEPTETWVFIIQDYFNAQGLGPELFGSMGICSTSLPITLSSSSILAVPEPGSALLLLLGSLSLSRRRRRARV